MLQCRFNEKVLIPSNGIERPGRYETADGVTVDVKFLGTWNNCEGDFTDELDAICLDEFGAPFMTINSIWLSRLGFISGYWHLVKLAKV